MEQGVKARKIPLGHLLPGSVTDRGPLLELVDDQTTGETLTFLHVRLDNVQELGSGIQVNFRGSHRNNEPVGGGNCGVGVLGDAGPTVNDDDLPFVSDGISVFSEV